MNSTHNTKTKRLMAAAASTVAPALLFVASGWFAAPAFAVCNEGTPHCVQVDNGHQRAKNQLNQSAQNCDGPDGFCDDSIPDGR
jgi:hypothetical protein